VCTENIATFGEISAGPVLRSLHTKMMNDPEAARILKSKPRINSRTVDLKWLSTLPENTFGAAYARFLKKNNVTPDSRLPVRFIQDPELAYVMQRYREVHDLVHTVSGQPTNMLGEDEFKNIR
jgi:ubiquinone biosynthesis protein COQ4